MTSSDKMQLDYVVSAIAMLGLNKMGFAGTDPTSDKVTETFKEVTRYADTLLPSKNYNHTTSMLFNAFVEDGFVKHIRKHEKYGMKDVYSDSGGLQMVTAGKTITPELKQGVYKVQAEASEYAMCFDVIALESMVKTRGKNERTNNSVKRFNVDKHVEAGIATGQNVKDQIRHFKSVGTNTKVIVIVQGNQAQDMVEFYRAINKQLSEDDYNYIGGMALADTCMGNKSLESVEMLKAARLISDEAHPNFSNHLHFLGVGSLRRLEPVLLLHENFLPNIKKVSYDSTSHSIAFNQGKWYAQESIGQYYNNRVDEVWRTSYSLFEPLMDELVGSYDRMKQLLLKPDGTYPMSHLYAQYKNDDTLNIGEKAFVAAFPYMHIRTIINDFIHRLDSIEDITAKDRPYMLSMKNVKDANDLDVWLRHNKHLLRSGRIKRSDDDNLEDMFGDD